MAKDLNKVQMTGRLGADPEMRLTPQGHAVTTFRVASNRSWRTSNGETQEDTEWFRVVAWNKLAEICDKWLSKGSRVYVEGRLQTRQWQDQDGQNRSITEVIASDLIILDARRDPVADGPQRSSELPVEAPPQQPAVSAAAQDERIPGRLPRPAMASRSGAAGHSRAMGAAALPRDKGAFEEEDLPF